MTLPTRKQLQSAIRIEQQYQARANRNNRGAQRQLETWRGIVEGMVEKLREAAEDGDVEARRILKIYGFE